MPYKILMLQAYESTYKKLADIAYCNKKYYCDKYGYELLSIEVSWANIKPAVWIIPTVIYNVLCDKYGYELLSIEVSWANIKPAVWIIPTVIYNVLCDKNYRNYDYIFWTDVDSLIMNFDIKLEDIIIKGKENNLIASMWNYNTTVSYSNLSGDIDVQLKPSNWFLIHTGNWFIKNNEWCKKFIGDLCNDNRFSRKDLLNAPGGDEFAFTIYYLNNPEIRHNFSLLPTDVFVSLDGTDERYCIFGKKMNINLYKKGDFIIHYPYQPTSVKEQLMIPAEIKRHSFRMGEI